MAPKHWKKSNIDRRFGRKSFNVLRSLKSLGGLAKWERNWKIVEFPFRNSKPVLSLPATRGRCPPSLCSCSGTQHQPGQRQQSVGNSSSSSLYISTEALFLGFIHPRQSCCSVRPDRISSSIHPPIHLFVFTSPSAQRCAASASAPQKVRHIIFDHRTCQLFSFFFSSLSPPFLSSWFHQRRNYYWIQRSPVSRPAGVFSWGASLKEKSPQYRGVEAIRLVVRPRGLIY